MRHPPGAAKEQRNCHLIFEYRSNLELHRRTGGDLHLCLLPGTSVLFTKASQQVGSTVVNRVRVVLALLFLMFLNWMLYGAPLPLDAGAERWFWLGLSGAIGYAIGDAFLFQAFIWIGTQRGMLMMSLAPLISAVLAWKFFGEVLTGMQLLGILMTLSGIAWVILQKRFQPDETGRQASTGCAVRAGCGYRAGSWITCFPNKA